MNYRSYSENPISYEEYCEAWKNDPPKINVIYDVSSKRLGVKLATSLRYSITIDDNFQINLDYWGEVKEKDGMPTTALWKTAMTQADGWLFYHENYMWKTGDYIPEPLRSNIVEAIANWIYPLLCNEWDKEYCQKSFRKMSLKE